MQSGRQKNKRMRIEKFSFGVGDRFGHEGVAQLEAIRAINHMGVAVVPVWNKSDREHKLTGSSPAELHQTVSALISASGYQDPYYIDADHINIRSVDRFLEFSNFFTIDVADYIGKKPSRDAVRQFFDRNRKYMGQLKVPGLDHAFQVTEADLARVAENYLVAMQEAAQVYKRICDVKGKENFVTEVSVDEAELPQGPLDLFFILVMLADHDIAVQTLAPKFSGLFAKGIDYIGDPAKFRTEFEQDVALIEWAKHELTLPDNLKISVHSGSDKFALYPIIREIIHRFDSGIHVKTAGTTWLEELIALAETGGEGLALAKEIYAASLERYDELTKPYATVLQIDPAHLPSRSEVDHWDGIRFAETLTHDQSVSHYNPHFRQLLHTAYKIAAEMGKPFTDALDRHHTSTSKRVKYNLLEKHLKPVFL
jgi:hypothetical protein